jgi:hypothetical protein
MNTKMTIDAINVANIASNFLSGHSDEDVQELVVAAKRLVSSLEEQCRELKRERVAGTALETQHASWTATRSSRGPTVVAVATFSQVAEFTPGKPCTS